jgi:hypothetical protein
VRRESAMRRDRRRLHTWEFALGTSMESRPDSSHALADTELLDHVERTLADDDRILFQLRRDGQDWDTISQQLNESSVLLRKRLSRAIRRVAAQLGLDGDDCV